MADCLKWFKSTLYQRWRCFVHCKNQFTYTSLKADAIFFDSGFEEHFEANIMNLATLTFLFIIGIQ